MRHDIQGIDHVVILTRDLDRAQDTYARLGFSLTPRGYHTLGSQNHCVMFGRDYIELLAVPYPNPALQSFTDFLARGEGLAAVAFATSNVDAAYAELGAAGIVVSAPLDFSRPVPTAEGARDAAFRIAHLPDAMTPGCHAFLCQHFTRELVWRPEFQSHALGATGLAAIAIVVEDPVAAAGRYAKLLDSNPLPIAEGRLVATGSVPIALVARGKLGRRLQGVELPARPRPLVAALYIRVADRGAAAATLRRGGFEPVALRDGAYAVDAAQALGVTLVFG